MDYEALARMALGFVCEDEAWPVFVAWVERTHVSGRAHEWAEAAKLNPPVMLAGTRAKWIGAHKHEV